MNVRLGFALICLAVSFVMAGRAEDDKTFPTDTEINLVVSQTDRTMQQYKMAIGLEETLLGKAGADAATRDRQVVDSIDLAVKAFRTRPQGFNSPLGFAFFEWLDDADRNASLCATGALSQSSAEMIGGKTAEATNLLHLAQNCMDVSTLIYTVSENAGALYARYAEAEDKLASQGLEVSQKCMDILKKNGLTPKK